MPKCLWVGGGAKKSSTPLPRGYVREKEREREKERQNNVERKISVVIHVPYGGVI